MKHLKLFEGFFSDMFDSNSNIDPEVELIEFNRMAHELEYPKENDPYLINYFVACLGKLMKYAKEHDLSLLDRIDINNAVRLYGIVRNRQHVIMATADDLENYYNEYKELTK